MEWLTLMDHSGQMVAMSANATVAKPLVRPKLVIARPPASMMAVVLNVRPSLHQNSSSLNRNAFI
jgi:hypothetical protein